MDKTSSINSKSSVDRFQDAWLHHKIASVRKVASHPEIIKALKKIYGRAPFPFQTLNFIKGSSQVVHSDAVHFHCIPHGFMCGIWIALEDVSEKAGPLFYYPGSHLLPYLSAKDLNLTIEEINSNPHPQTFFQNTWERYLNEREFKKEHFIAKRGDVFIWHSNLLHGGSMIKEKTITRRSQVTHYFFKGCAYKRPFLDTIGSTSNSNQWFNPNDLTKSY